MLYFELLAELSDHLVIQIGTVVCNDSFRDAVSTDQVMPNELCHDVLGYCGVGSCLNPLREVINGNQDEAVSVRSCRFDFSNYVNAPHRKWPRRS